MTDYHKVEACIYGHDLNVWDAAGYLHDKGAKDFKHEAQFKKINFLSFNCPTNLDWRALLKSKHIKLRRFIRVKSNPQVVAVPSDINPPAIPSEPELHTGMVDSNIQDTSFQDDNLSYPEEQNLS